MDLKALWQNMQENVGFLLVCLLIFVGLFLIALLLERFWLKPKKFSSARRRLTSAFSALLPLC